MELFVVTLVVLINAVAASPVYRKSIPFLSAEAESCEIIVTEAEKTELKYLSRAGLTQSVYRWPNNTIVYNMDSPPFEKLQIDLVVNSLKQIEEVSCLKFVQRTNEDYFINITANSGCSSQVGYQQRLQNTPQRMNLNIPGCMYPGIIIHEFLHALGFYHMQSASNRDEYVTIMWENIQKGKEHNFDKYGEDRITDFGIEYDVLSIMHYGAFDFSANREPTIEPHNPALKQLMGQRNGLSEKDIARINKMYGCN